MKLACLDTQVLIWAIKKEATAGQEEMIERASMLIDRLAKSEIKIVIPTISSFPHQNFKLRHYPFVDLSTESAHANLHFDCKFA